MAIKTRRIVLYVHHSRDRDGDIVFFFKDMQIGGGHALVQSSPVVSIRRSRSAVLDLRGRGGLGKYLIETQRSLYEVQMPHDRAEHLARELRVGLP